MRKIGLVGGTGWPSTLTYYRMLNAGIARRYGGNHSAPMAIENIEFHRLEKNMRAGRWGLVTTMLSEAAQRLEASGAEAVLLCSNTIHRVAEGVGATIAVPLIDIRLAVADAIRRKGYGTVGLWGTKSVTEGSFYSGSIQSRGRAEVLSPYPDEADHMHTMIFQRLTRDIFTRKDKKTLAALAEDMQKRGAEAIILGCTELPLALGQAKVPLIDSARAHCDAALRFMRGKAPYPHAAPPDRTRRARKGTANALSGLSP